jgi:hypothetical protein
MDSLASFMIASQDGRTALRFDERQPPDRALPLVSYRVTVSAPNLTASALVQGGHAGTHPVGYLAVLASRHRDGGGWAGEESWDALAHEFSLRASHDRDGGVCLWVRIGSRTSGWDFDWDLRFPIGLAADGRAALAVDAARFFGPPASL